MQGDRQAITPWTMCPVWHYPSRPSAGGTNDTPRLRQAIAASDWYRGLLLGQRVGRQLRYVGTVEWGVGRALVEALPENVPTRTVSPFTDHRRHRGAVWLEPKVVVEVTFSEFVGGWLRDPVLRRLVLT